jgi:hypothetical protein
VLVDEIGSGFKVQSSTFRVSGFEGSGFNVKFFIGFTFRPIIV